MIACSAFDKIKYNSKASPVTKEFLEIENYVSIYQSDLKVSSSQAKSMRILPITSKAVSCVLASEQFGPSLQCFFFFYKISQHLSIFLQFCNKIC